MTTQQKQCPRCEKTKSLGDFYADRSRKDGLQCYCKQCFKDSGRQRYWSDPERARLKGRVAARKLRAANPEESLRKQRAYTGKHRERYRGHARRWGREHPESKRVRNQRRRASKRGVSEHFTQEMNKFVRGFWNHGCALCGSETNLCIDHWLPLSKGHALAMDNAVVLCFSCNSKKRSRLPESFLEGATVNRVQRMLKKQIVAWRQHSACAAAGTG